ncbi:hypothetical protein (doubtful CDS) [Clavibacter sepedonicus]|uniref:Uncharacterized protein n=1 Tax=Clavibacter sepedonicus TaxID=31964 RepID=B0RGF9_CLASE|nr:hypothetical protein (doubtful CDS) [Clavibacter sepedonicus]
MTSSANTLRRRPQRQPDARQSERAHFRPGIRTLWRTRAQEALKEDRSFNPVQKEAMRSLSLKRLSLLVALTLVPLAAAAPAFASAPSAA